MGLDTTHGAWHGAYSAFARWRQEIAEVAGIPLMLTEGFYRVDNIGRSAFSEALSWVAPGTGGNGPQCGSYYGPVIHRYIEDVRRWLPVKWESLRPDILHVLLNHSDCDGEISPEHCGALAIRLTELLPLLPDGDGGGHIGNWREKTQTFIDGLRRAASAGEPLGFH